MKNTKWYENAIIYQIYPRSFMDSNNDGLGDIPGIISKLDYLKELGVNCVWLSPVYDSPQQDNGYDIKNYVDIYPPFGNLDDFKLMLDEMHKRGIRLIMDLVVNHTSDEHKWFIEAKKSKDNPYRDYYIWKKGKGKKNKRPNNWLGFFGAPAWEYDKTTDEYYLHLFDKKQPDLNWENPKIIEEVKSLMKFWLDIGVDGFRCDVINLISKDQRFKSSLQIPAGAKYYVNGPRLHEFLHEINKDVLSNYDCMTVGETAFTTLEDARLLTSPERQELNTIFNFDHTNADNFMGIKWLYRKFSLPRMKKSFKKWQVGNIWGWNTLFIENHDQRRCVGRFNTNDKELRVESSKMLGTMCYFQKGTPYIYQGQEIGMTNAYFKDLNQYQDTEVFTIHKLLTKLHLPKKFINFTIPNGARDNARTPMQWDDSEYAGFSKVNPWLSVNENKSYINVEEAKKDPNSILNYYKKLIQVHKEQKEIINNGDYVDLCINHKKIFAYTRTYNNEILLCISNFSNKETKYKLPKHLVSKEKELLLNNYNVNNINEETLILKPYETRLYKVK